MTVSQKLVALTAVTVLCIGFSGCCGKRCLLGGCGASHAVSAPVSGGCDTCSAATSSYAQPSYAQPSYEQSSYSAPAYSQPSYSQPSYSEPAYSSGGVVSGGSGTINAPSLGGFGGSGSR